MLSLASFALSPDVTPDAVNWANISGNSPQSNANQTMSGFSGTLTLVATISGFSSVGATSRTLQMNKNNGAELDTPIAANGATASLNFVAGDVVKFTATQTTSGNSWAGTVTVTCAGVTLDTFTVSVSVP